MQTNKRLFVNVYNYKLVCRPSGLTKPADGVYSLVNFDTLRRTFTSPTTEVLPMAEPSREKTGSARELVRKLLRLKVVEEAYRSDRSTACNQCGQAIQTSAISTVYYRLEDPRPIIHRRFCSARCGDEYEIETAVRAGFIKAGEVRRDEPKAVQIAGQRQPPPSPASRPKPVEARPLTSRTSEIAQHVDQLVHLGFKLERKGDDIILRGSLIL